RDGAESTLVQLSAALQKADSDKETPLTFAFADADFKDPRYASTAELLGVRQGWKTSSSHTRARQTSVWRLGRPIRMAEGDEIVVTLRSDTLGCVRLCLSPFGAEDPRETTISQALIDALNTPSAALSPSQLGRLHGAYLLGTGWDAPALVLFYVLQDK